MINVMAGNRVVLFEWTAGHNINGVRPGRVVAGPLVFDIERRQVGPQCYHIRVYAPNDDTYLATRTYHQPAFNVAMQWISDWLDDYYGIE